jgi:hypothetical protein
MIASGIIICHKKKVKRKGIENPATKAYLIENKSQVPSRRSIATARTVRVAFKLRMISAIRIVMLIHRSREYRIEKLRR